MLITIPVGLFIFSLVCDLISMRSADPAAWTLVGMIGGVAMMFGKVPPIAESGAKPSDLWFYAFWIPVLGVAAGVFGFALGVLFSMLMALLKNWRSRAEARARVVGKYGPRILCGTLAGAVIPELVKVFTSTESRHVKEVVISAQEGGASLGILSGFVAGNFSGYYLGLAMMMLMAVAYYMSTMGLALAAGMLAPAVFAFAGSEISIASSSTQPGPPRYSPSPPESGRNS